MKNLVFISDFKPNITLDWNLFIYFLFIYLFHLHCISWKWWFLKSSITDGPYSAFTETRATQTMKANQMAELKQ